MTEETKYYIYKTEYETETKTLKQAIKTVKKLKQKHPLTDYTIENQHGEIIAEMIDNIEIKEDE